jgi:L,D-peptidoglycan transpeptidase YkuD (ErfK/YbiS/YcfS/YnhG family)
MTENDLVLTKYGIRFRNRLFPCAHGRSGVTCQKQEGDGATPVGAHPITRLYYRPDRLSPPVTNAIPIRPFDLWSDDISDPDYNHLVTAPHPFSHETMRRADPLYDLVLVTGWNWPIAVPGLGSAIFLHVWRGPGASTEGCVAFSRPDLLWIIKRLTPRSRLIVPQP